METRSNLRKISLLAGAALLSSGALAAPTEAATITKTEIVKYSALESATPTGAKLLYGKLRAAATRVCSTSVPATNIPYVDLDCAADALSSAVAEVGNPLVTALHRDMRAGSRMAGAKQAQSSRSETMAKR